MNCSFAHTPAWRVRGLFAALLVFLPLQAAQPERAEDEAALKAKYEKVINALPWKTGPGQQSLGGRAELKFSHEYRFLDSAGAKSRLKLAGNRMDDRDILGMVEHLKDNWWVVFEFDAIGYVKDDEKDKLNAAQILAAYKKSLAAENEQREGPPTTVVGWHTPPNYNEKTHNLEWAIIFENSGEQYVNYRVKLLGRHGVVDGTWVGDLKALDTAAPQFRQVLQDFKYNSGETYAEYRTGDKIARYGLGALVLGGATLGAAKLGLFPAVFLFLKKGFKVIIAAVIGVGAWLKRLFTGRRRESAE